MSLSTNNKQKSLPSSPISTDYVHLSTNDYSKLDFPKVKSSQILKEGGERYFTLILSNNIGLITTRNNVMDTSFEDIMNQDNITEINKSLL